jgi:DNA-binding response OmpR family regulator
MATVNSRRIDLDRRTPHVSTAAAGESPGATRATTILIVDDDEMVVTYLSHIIASAGYEVVTATSAQDALVALRRDSVRIAILDVMMPGTDGLELCRTIRSRTYAGYVYLILHTAKLTDADIVAGLAAGADDYMAKGTSRDQIIERLRTAQQSIVLKRGL